MLDAIALTDGLDGIAYGPRHGELVSACCSADYDEHFDDEDEDKT